MVGFGGWQDYALSDGKGVINMGRDPENPSWALGVLGMPGLTAWAGLTQIGQPKAGETLVVAAASGPVGATVGQIAADNATPSTDTRGTAAYKRHLAKELTIRSLRNAVARATGQEV